MRLVREISFVSERLRVHVNPDVLSFLHKHRQPTWFANERAGQLFGLIDGCDVRIVEATGPRRGDRADHVSYNIDRVSAQREIDERYAVGLHYLGDWHTHPQRRPKPSGRDESSMQLLFASSRHDLECIIMLIVGCAGPASWWCSTHGPFGMEHIPQLRRA